MHLHQMFVLTVQQVLWVLLRMPRRLLSSNLQG
jgi:hypothetical protein